SIHHTQNDSDEDRGSPDPHVCLQTQRSTACMRVWRRAVLGTKCEIYPTGLCIDVECLFPDREGFEDVRSFEASGRRLVRYLLAGDANREVQEASELSAHGTGNATWI